MSLEMPEQLEVGGGIYAIKNLVTQRVYVGQSVVLRSRFRVHRHLLRTGSHFNVWLQRSFLKHGESAFVFLPLLYSDEGVLDLLEKRVMDSFPKKYNIVLEQSNSSRGLKRSLATRQKQSLLKLNDPLAMERARLLSKKCSKQVSLKRENVETLFVSQTEASKYLGVSATTVRNYKRSGKFLQGFLIS